MVAEAQAAPITARTPEPPPEEQPGYWRKRIEAAVRSGKSYHRNSEDRRRAMLGPAFIDGMSGNTVGQEPLWWRTYRNYVPRVGMGTPGFTAKSKNPGGMDGLYGYVAEADEHALNQNAKDAKLGEELLELADDTFWGMGVTLRKMVPIPDDAHLVEPAYDDNGQLLPPVGRPRMMCKSFRIRPSWTFQDPSGGRRRMAFAGHMEVIHKDDALSATDDAGSPLYDAEAIEDLAKTSDAAKVQSGPGNGYGTAGELADGQIVLYHVWCRRTRMIYTLGYSRTAAEDQGRFLRKARYFGPPEGPYTFYGSTWFADFIFPLPLSVTLQRIIELMQVHRAKDERDAAAAKTGVVTGSPKAQKKITSGKNNSVWHIPGASRDNTFSLPVGGPQEATARHLERLEAEYQLAGGQSLAIQGGPNTGTSATADALAASQAESQAKMARESFLTSLRQDVEGWVWFYHNAPDINFDVTITDPVSGEDVTMPYRGVMDQPIPVPVHSIELQVDPFSVGFQTPAELEARSTRLGNQIAFVLGMQRQFPEFEAENFLADLMDRTDTRGGPGRYVNLEMARMFRQMAAQQALGLMDPATAPLEGGAGDGVSMAGDQGPDRRSDPGALPGRSAGSRAGANVKSGKSPANNARAEVSA